MDKLHGQPTLDTLIHLLRQLKINVQSVPTTLGSGQLGYLALVLPEASFNAIPNSRPFVRPVHPGPFIVTSPTAGIATKTSTLTPTITAAVVTQQKANWDDKVRIYNDCQAVEQALRQQLVEAIDPTFLDALRNPYTYMVQSSIPAIMRHLQQSYGFLTDEELSDKEDALKSYIYDPVKTVDDVFNKITKQQELCILMNNPMPDKQQVSIAYKIFSRAHIFQNALIK